jgi:putative addiction module killer protein
MAEIVYYGRPDGGCPFAGWFSSLNAKAAARVTTVIERMADGNMGDVKPVGDGVSERRIDYGPGYRIYFGRDGSEIVLLLTGGTKKRQQADIRQAKALWAEYKQRKKGN